MKKAISILLLAALVCLPAFTLAEGAPMDRIFTILQENATPATIEDYDRLATIAYARGEYEAALSYITQALPLAGDDPAFLGAIWVQIASLHVALSQTDEALAALETAAGYTPDDPQLRSLQASLLPQTGADEAAAPQEDAAAYFLRAAARMQAGQNEAAIADLLTALSLGYEDPAVCYEYLSSCYFLTDQYEKVLESGNQVIALGSETPAYDTLYQRMGIAALALEDMPQAEGYFTQSIQQNDALTGNLYYRSLARMGQQDYAAAAGDLTLSIEKDELTQRCHYNRALCLLQLGDVDGAITDLEAALTLPGEEDITAAAKDLLWQLALEYINPAP